MSTDCLPFVAPLDWLGALSPSTMLGTLSRFDKLKALTE